MHTHGLGAWMAKRRLKSPETTALVFDGADKPAVVARGLYRFYA